MPKVPEIKTDQPLARPELKVRLFVGPDALTVEQAKQLLGWEVVNVKDKAVVSELVPLCGQHVRLTKNTRNRYLTISWLLTLRQEHLQRRWRFNGETIVISKTDQVLSGQHRLLSLIIAEIERLGVNADHWKERGWDRPVTMETLIVFGVDDDDDTFKTLNCGKPGTLAEILYRSEYFSKLSRDKRKACAGIMDRAIKLLWHRTGSDTNAFAPRRTHGETMDFLGRHQKLLKAVLHIYEEDDGGDEGRPIGKYVDPGAAAGLMFLMGTGESKLEVYNGTTPPSQDGLSFSLWDKASEFWVAFAGKGSLFQHLKDAIVALSDPVTGTPGSLKAKLILIVKAWLRFVANKAVTADCMTLATEKDDDGASHLVEKVPSCGGIDLGEPSQAEPVEEDEPEPEPETAPTPPKTKAKAKAPAVTATVPDPAAKPSAPTLPPKSLKDELDAHRTKAPGRLLLFKRTTSYRAFDGDSKILGKLLKAKIITESELPHADFPTGNFDAAVAKLQAAGHKVSVVEQVIVDNNGTKEGRVTNLEPEKKGKK